ncbi:MAG: diaminopimelate epimerase [Bacteroidetes bacterium]|nr:diaminopimelate epimerase [Bacteroidota bacterium]
MHIHFYKYQGTGNDFIMLDNRAKEYSHLTQKQIEILCDRKFGIGADGLILLEESEGYDFKMVYFNADGSESTMCGNGGRCIVKFAEHLGIVKSNTRFLAIDGAHEATLQEFEVKLKMNDVAQITNENNDYILNTGSPHFVRFVEQIKTLDVYTLGNAIRNSTPFVKEGINVNFVEIFENDIYVRTYERGVEDETLSCGTGCTAAAIGYHKNKGLSDGIYTIPIETPGGYLKVYFTFEDQQYHDVWLEGAALQVYAGTINL